MEVVENTWIPMSDGCRLAAKLWIPKDAAARPVPAILEYLPYRKRDCKRVRDSGVHGFFADRGYAGVRVDLRGSGDSDGLLTDEYMPQELEDGVEVIRWIAEQPWCDGSVGMIGLSWGGFNGLQIAALRPPALKAVVTICSSDDRYTDDVHYMGGCHLTDNLSWASVMLAYNACPPDPEVVGERWREMWLERLEQGGLWLKNWLEHQRRDEYWKHASVCDDYAAIECPVYAVSGWQDGYCNTVFRLVENLPGPCKGLVGPWGHKYPHLGGPGPEIDFLGECVRWWDRWLKGKENGIDREPALKVWMQDPVLPLSDDRPGRWVAEEGWPARDIRREPLTLGPGRLCLDGGDPGPNAALKVQSPLHVGLFAGKWCSYSESTDLPTDQRLEDGGALVFDSPVLEEDLEILGAPVAELELSADQPQAMIAVRLSDVGPDGTVALVTYGLLNLSHRDGHASPEPLVPGQRYKVRVRLNHIAQHFSAGNRIRLQISSSYWPLAWPSPTPAALTIYTGESTLELPRRRPRESDTELRDFGPPRAAQSVPTTLLEPARREWTVTFNLANNEATLNVLDDDDRVRLDDIDLAIDYDVRERYSYRNDDYATVRGEVENMRLFERDGWRIEVRTRTVVTSDESSYRIQAQLDAYEDGIRVFSRNWDERIPRDHM